MERNEIKTLYLPKNAQVGIFRIVRRIQRQNYERLCWRAAAPSPVDIIHLILARCSYWIYSGYIYILWYVCDIHIVLHLVLSVIWYIKLTREIMKKTTTECASSCSISTLSSPAVLTEYIHDQLPVTINEMETTAQTKEKHCLAWLFQDLSAFHSEDIFWLWSL